MTSDDMRHLLHMMGGSVETQVSMHPIESPYCVCRIRAASDDESPMRPYYYVQKYLYGSRLCRLTPFMQREMASTRAVPWPRGRRRE
jgi:hypothetical protein